MSRDVVDGRTGHILWGKEETGENVYEAALDRIRNAYALFDTIIVSFSGGKDSTAVLNLTIQVAEELGRLPVKAIHVDEEAIPYETEDYVRRVAADPRVDLDWWCTVIEQRNACSDDAPHWYNWAPEDRDLWCREMPPEAITDPVGVPLAPGERVNVAGACSAHLAARAAELGQVGLLLGIRADESLTRRRAVSSAKAENYIVPGGAPNIQKVYPIYDWVTADVWTAPALFGWDYNAAYDLMEMAGVPHSAQRCAPPYAEQPLRGLYIFKLVAPTLWDRMCRRVPGASTGARYGNTALYSFGALPEAPPEGLTWPEFIAQRLGEQPEEIRPQIARTIQRYIRHHFTRTTDPIVGTAPHPRTGQSWQFLYMVADRGDLKLRTWPDYGGAPGTDRRRKAEEAYERVRSTEDPRIWEMPA